jgi:hypothetical protein
MLTSWRLVFSHNHIKIAFFWKVTSLSFVDGTDVSVEPLFPFSYLHCDEVGRRFFNVSVPSTKLHGVISQNTVIFNSIKAESCLGKKHTLSYQLTWSLLVSALCGILHVLHCAETKDHNLITICREYLKTRSATYTNFPNFTHMYTYSLCFVRVS